MNKLPMQTPQATHGLLKSILLGLIILAAGIAIGISLTLLLLNRQTDRIDQEPELFAERMLHQLNRDLNLTPQQRQQLDPILQAHYRALRDIRAEVRPKIVEQLEQLDYDIVSVLDEQQEHIWQRQIQRLEDYFPTLRERRRGLGRGAGLEPGQRGPHGPKEPLGPGYRRNINRETFDRNELPSELPDTMPP